LSDASELRAFEEEVIKGEASIGLRVERAAGKVEESNSEQVRRKPIVARGQNVAC